MARVPEHASFDYPFLHIEAATDQDGHPTVRVAVEPDPRGWAEDGYDRAEFLRAVETELNVIVINRTDLPKVTEGPDGSLNARGATLTSDGNAYGSDALGWLAIAEYLEAHPPVDQAAVDALIESIVRADDSADLTGAQVANLARRLIKAGVRPPKAD